MAKIIEITDWDKVRNYKMSQAEEKLCKKIFQEYLEGNSGFDDCSNPQLESFYETFKHGWIMCQIFFE